MNDNWLLFTRYILCVRAMYLYCSVCKKIFLLCYVEVCIVFVMSCWRHVYERIFLLCCVKVCIVFMMSWWRHGAEQQWIMNIHPIIPAKGFWVYWISMATSIWTLLVVEETDKLVLPTDIYWMAITPLKIQLMTYIIHSQKTGWSSV